MDPQPTCRHFVSNWCFIRCNLYANFSFVYLSLNVILFLTLMYLLDLFLTNQSNKGWCQWIMSPWSDYNWGLIIRLYYKCLILNIKKYFLSVHIMISIFWCSVKLTHKMSIMFASELDPPYIYTLFQTNICFIRCNLYTNFYLCL